MFPFAERAVRTLTNDMRTKMMKINVVFPLNEVIRYMRD
jgi:hypothetical protein